MLGLGCGVSKIAFLAKIIGLGPPPVTPADYTVTNDAEWDAVFANSAATLSGKIVEVEGSNFTSRTIASKDFTAEGAPVVLRSADASSSVPRVSLNNVDGVDFSGFNFQMTGWPKTHPACVRYDGGTVTNIRFLNGTKFRHGYGPSLLDFDTTADLPEYERIDNVQTATTTSTTYALTWKDAAATSGWIEFFNRGTETVHAVVGGSGVTATTGDTSIAPGSRVRFPNLDPTADTHIAIISAAGTSEVNPRTEIGLFYYLADAFERDGGVTIGNIEAWDCEMCDLANAFKGILKPTRLVLVRNTTRRIYMDTQAGSLADGGVAYILGNLCELGFSRSGIAEGDLGDALDPHPDGRQFYGDDLYTIGPIYSAGNLPLPTNRRVGCTGQEFFLADNTVTPGFSDVYAICDVGLGGAPNAFYCAKPGTILGDALWYGLTAFGVDVPLADGESTIRIDTDGNYTTYVGHSLAQAFDAVGEAFDSDSNTNILLAANPDAVFPNLGDFATATTRSQIIAALTPAAEGLGLGVANYNDAINLAASDPEDFIKWQNVPSGVHWNDQNQLPADTLTTLPLRKVMNLRTGQTVTPGAGVEWQSYQSDGVTVDTAWTTASGTVDGGQYIQARMTTSADALGIVTMNLTINGFTQTTKLTTAVGDPTEYLTAQGGYFVDPAGGVPASTTRITWRGKVYFPTVPTGPKPVAQRSTGCDLEVTPDKTFKLTLEDGTGVKLLSGVEFVGSVIADATWHDLVFDVDHAAGTADLTIDGTNYQLTFTPSANAFFQTGNEFSMLSNPFGSSGLFPNGARIADMSIDFNGTLHKAIDNDPVVANADPWKQGVDFT